MEHIIFLYVFFTGCVYTSWLWDTKDPFVLKFLNIGFGVVCGWCVTPILIGRAIKQVYKRLIVMAQKKDKEKYGRDFAPECEFEVFILHDNTDWCANIAIGDFYYETDYYTNRQDAIDEQRGCLLAIKEQIEKYLEKLD